MLFLLCLTLFLAGTASAQPSSVQEAFAAGNEAYAQGQYDRAVDRYRSVLEVGYTSAALYYNLGNAYYRLDQVGEAVQHYEKARRLRPDDPRVRHNLKRVRERIDGPGAGGEAGTVWERMVTGWPVEQLFAAGWVLLMLGGGLLAAGALRRGPARQVGTVGSLAVGILLVSVALGASALQTATARGVLLTGEVPLRTAPSDTASVHLTLPEGATVALDRRDTTWTRVRLPNGRTGWIPSRAIGEI